MASSGQQTPAAATPHIFDASREDGASTTTPAPEANPQQWELSKENYVPIKSGRQTTSLQEVAAEPVPSVSKQALEQKRREFLKEILDRAYDDPIEPWQRYLKWTQEHIVGSGGLKVEVQRVLEACTKDLLKHERYRTDIRFLRIWVLYADCLPDPGDVFVFLKEKRIGLDFALFYEACATYYELKGNVAAADSVYMNGINGLAQPLERLKQKYAAFQKRMAQRIQRRIQESALDGPPTMAPAAGRSALAPVGPPCATSLPANHSRTRQQQQPGAVGTTVGSRPLGSSLAGMFNPRPAAIARAAAVPFVLPDADRGAGSLAGGGLRKSVIPAIPLVDRAAAKDLQPYATIRKENMDKPVAWAGTTLTPATVGCPGTLPLPTAAPASSSLEIYTDEEFLEEEEVARRPAAVPASFRKTLEQVPAAVAQPPAPAAPVNVQCVAGLGQPATYLTAQMVPAPGQVRAGGPAAAEMARRAALKPVPTSTGFDARLLVGAVGIEQSFEEVRAKLHLPTTAVAMSASCDCGGDATVVSALAQPAKGASAAVGAQGLAAAPASLNRCNSGTALRQQGDPGRPGEDTGLPVNQYASVPLHIQPVARSDDVSSGDVAVQPARAKALQDMPGPTYTQSALGSASAAILPHPPAASGGVTAVAACTAMPLQPATSTSTSAVPAALAHCTAGALPRRRALGVLLERPADPLAMLSSEPSTGPVASMPQPLQPRPLAAALQPRQVVASQAPPPLLQARSTTLQPPAALSETPQRGSKESPALPSSPPPPQQQQQQQQSQPLRCMPEPTVTISTRDAFDMLNGMFCDTPAPQMGLKAVPGAWAPLTAPREPTVTLSTQAAFDFMNGLFSDQAPRDDELRQSSLPLRTADVCRLANTGKLPLANGLSAAASRRGGSSYTPAGIYEDTDFVRPSAGARGTACVAGTGIYEDTDFVRRAQGARGTGSSTAAGIYEDTDFVQQALGGHGGSSSSCAVAGMCGGNGLLPPAGGTGLGGCGTSGGSGAVSDIFEDSELVPSSAGASRMNSSAELSRVGVRGPTAPSVYEDTEFMSAGGLGQGGGRCSAAAGGGIYEDTDFVRPAVPAPHQPRGLPGMGPLASLPLYEDTEFVSRPAEGPAAGRLGSGVGAGLAQLPSLPAALTTTPYEDTDYCGGAALHTLHMGLPNQGLAATQAPLGPSTANSAVPSRTALAAAGSKRQAASAALQARPTQRVEAAGDKEN